MKRLAIVSLLSLCTAGAYAQGTLQFFNSFSDLQFQIYAPGSNPNLQTQGDTAAQIATDGAANLSANGDSTSPVTYSSTAIGGFNDPSPSATIPTHAQSAAFDAAINYTYGNDFTAQIYALSAGASPGATPAFSSLLPVTQYIENFATSGGANFANLAAVSFNAQNPDPGIPGTGYDNSNKHGASHVLNNAFVAVAAWYNAGGTVTTLAQAQADNLPWGISAVNLVAGLGEPGSVNTAAAVNSGSPSTPVEPYYQESFNLTYTTVPEPGTIALGLAGVCGFLARRRKK